MSDWPKLAVPTFNVNKPLIWGSGKCLEQRSALHVTSEQRDCSSWLPAWVVSTGLAEGRFSRA